MVMNFIRCALSGTAFISLSFLKDNFFGKSTLGWQVFSSSTLSMSMEGGQIADGGLRTDEASVFQP